MQEQKPGDVVVVGAGLSGLSAAIRLKEKNPLLNVTILEARDRVGGRTHSIKSKNGVHFDLGGQWVGPTQPDINRLAKELKCDTYYQHHAGKKIVDLKGKVSYYSGEIPTCLGLLTLLDVQQMIWRMNWMTRKIPTTLDKNFYSCKYIDEWDAINCETFLRNHAWTQATILLVEAVIRGLLGVELSLLNFLLYCNTSGGVETLISIPKGNQQRVFVKGSQQISKKLAKKFQSLCKTPSLYLNSTVQSIRKLDDHLEITCSDQRTFKAKHVILALPPVIANKITFTPRLPPFREKLMQKNFLGSIIKTVLFYKEPFWREMGFSGEVVCDCEEGIVHNVFDKTVPLPRRKGDNTDSTVREQPGLVCFVNGSNAVYASEYMTAEMRRKEVLSQLEKWFGPKALEPIEYFEKDWVSDEYARGCPCGIFPSGALWQVGHLLRETDYDGLLHWAGTETATRQMGYMDGAVQAGERAAEEVLDALQQQQCDEKSKQLLTLDKLGTDPLIRSRRNPRTPSGNVTTYLLYLFFVCLGVLLSYCLF